MKKKWFLCLTVGLCLLLSCSKSGDSPRTDGCPIPVLNKSADVASTRPCAIAVSRSGLVAVGEYNGLEQYGGQYGSAAKIRVYRNYRDFLSGAAPFAVLNTQGAEALAFDQAENLYIAETEAVAGIAVYRNLKQGNPVIFDYVRTIQGGMNNPRGLAFDSHNRLYIANDGIGNIIRVDNPAGNYQQQIIGLVGVGIKGLAIAEDTIYCTNYNQNEILVLPLKPDGTFGEAIYHSIDVAQPVDITVNSSLFAVSSPVSGKISLYDRKGFLNSNYVGCTKEIAVGSNLFGIALFAPTPGGTGLLAANLDQNKVIYYQSK